MVGTGAFLIASIGIKAMAQGKDVAHNHAHTHGSAFGALIAAAGDCVVKGQECLAHCLILLAEGDKAMARVALEACQLCEKECRKHESKHAECKACMESCLNCIKQCKALVA